MRIKLDNPKIFFKSLLAENNMTLIQLSDCLKISYSTLKKYAQGKLTLPENVFDSCLHLYKEKKEPSAKIQKINDHWGQTKGGLNAAKKDKKNKRLSHARKFRKIKKVDIKLDKEFCELYGIILGDGCISKYKDSRGFFRYGIFITENMTLDAEHLKGVQKTIQKKYKLNPYYYKYPKSNSCVLRVFNKDLCIRLNKEFGIPIGTKYEKLNMSNKILVLPWATKKFILRGLFDTDGSIFARKDENYKYPHIAITSKSIRFLNQMKKMLREKGYPAYINGADVRIKGIGPVNKWFNDIGSSNPRNINKYKYFLEKGKLPARKLGSWSNG